MYESYNEWHKLELASEVEFDKFITYSSLNIIIFLTQNQVIKKNRIYHPHLWIAHKHMNQSNRSLL